MGGRLDPTYKIWRGMRNRCLNPTYGPGWKDYGGRGISICDRWQNYSAFLADMGPRPSRQHTIDRIDYNGPYSPDNCRWATMREQALNRRPRTHCLHGHELSGENVRITKVGKRACVTCQRRHKRNWRLRQKTKAA